MDRNGNEFRAPTPAADLKARILLSIEKRERRVLIMKTVAFGAVLLASLVLIVFGAMDLAAEATRSGFSAFTSLLFSDFSVKLATSSDFLLSIVESFPIFSAVVLLSGIFSAIWSAAEFLSEVTLVRGRTFTAIQ